MTILGAVDGEHRPDKVVETAHELAAAYGDDLVVLNVLEEEAFDDRQRRREQQDSTYLVDDGRSDAKNAAEQVVEATLGEANAEEVTVRGRVGEPVNEILNEADRLDARYFVIGGRKRTAVGKAIFGSVTQSLLLNADLPVVTVMREE